LCRIRDRVAIVFVLNGWFDEERERREPLSGGQREFSVQRLRQMIRALGFEGGLTERVCADTRVAESAASRS